MIRYLICRYNFDCKLIHDLKKRTYHSYMKSALFPLSQNKTWNYLVNNAFSESCRQLRKDILLFQAKGFYTLMLEMKASVYDQR